MLLFTEQTRNTDFSPAQPLHRPLFQWSAYDTIKELLSGKHHQFTIILKT